MIKLFSLTFWLFLLCGEISAEPWVNTKDLQLRSDIETLADIGVLSVPISTYPLMWSGIIENLDMTLIEKVPSEFKDVYWRVKKASRAVFSKTNRRSLKLSLSSSEKTFRSFGDDSRGKQEIVATSSNMSKQFAWNIEVATVNNPVDGDKTRYDGSYFSLVLSNWIVTVGAVEQWWGASWDSANLLSNNARPTEGISLTRNYSTFNNNQYLKFLGGWTFTGFVNQLDDPNFIDKTYLKGASFSFKPTSSLETSFRFLSIVGGASKVDGLVADNKKAIGFDLRWRLPSFNNANIPTSVYASFTEKKFDSGLSALQIGVTSQINIFDNYWRFYLESTDTALGELEIMSDSNDYNRHRNELRAVGSTYGDDSKVISFGMIGRLTYTQNLSIKLQNIKLNQREVKNTNDLLQSVNTKKTLFNQLKANWSYRLSPFDKINIELLYRDKKYKFNDISENKKLFLSWTHFI